MEHLLIAVMAVCIVVLISYICHALAHRNEEHLEKSPDDHF